MRSHLAIGWAAVLLAASCEEPFEPKGDFQERPILYCVLSGSNLGLTSQTALLHQTYDIEGYDPTVDSTSSAIRDAQVVLTIASTPHIMTESLVELPTPSRYGMFQRVYRVINITVRPGAAASIEANLPSGEILTAATTIPPFRYFELSYKFPHGVTTQTNRLVTGNAWTLSWHAPEEHLYDFQLLLHYSVRDTGGATMSLTREIPLRYVRDGGAVVPLYPRRSHDTSATYDFDAIDSTMAAISAGDPDKGRYTIVSVSFWLLEFDAPLSRYYSSIKGGIDDYSIRMDANAYSNVDGGMGVFGSYTESDFSYQVDRDYAHLFGYALVGD